MIWRTSHRADPRARAVADRHYSRQKVGSPQFVQPGSCCVFYAEADGGTAYWVTSWPKAEYVMHAWAGAWQCTAFRNEGVGQASELIRAAVAATRHHYGEPPPLGMVTFIDTAKVAPVIVRGLPTWGRSWHLAGFRYAGQTKAGLLALRLAPKDMPPPEPTIGAPCGTLKTAA